MYSIISGVKKSSKVSRGDSEMVVVGLTCSMNGSRSLSMSVGDHFGDTGRVLLGECVCFFNAEYV